MKKIKLAVLVVAISVLNAASVGIAQAQSSSTGSGSGGSGSTTTGTGATTPATGGSAIPADSKSAVCDGIALTGGTCDPSSSSALQGVVSNAIGIISWIVGIAAVIMIMVGGVKYIMSQGDGNSVTSAKNTILYAVIGLVIAMFAQLIVRFVVNRV